jgi:hypothetical protein
MPSQRFPYATSMTDDLGEQIESGVEALAEAIAGTDVPGDSYPLGVGRPARDAADVGGVGRLHPRGRRVVGRPSALARRVPFPLHVCRGPVRLVVQTTKGSRAPHTRSASNLDLHGCS